MIPACSFRSGTRDSGGPSISGNPRDDALSELSFLRTRASSLPSPLHSWRPSGCRTQLYEEARSWPRVTQLPNYPITQLLNSSFLFGRLHVSFDDVSD